MPILRNAKKALRSSKRKAVVNSRVRTGMRNAITAVNTTATQETVSKAFSKIDLAVKNNLIHKNKAARLKSQLSRLVTA